MTTYTGYCRVRFTSKNGATASLIFAVDDVRRMTIADISRRWPYSESLKMATLEVGPTQPTWDDAFSDRFPDEA